MNIVKSNNLKINFNKNTKNIEIIWNCNRYEMQQYNFNFYATNCIRAMNELDYIKSELLMKNKIELIHYRVDDMEIDINYMENVMIDINKKYQIYLSIDELKEKCDLIYSFYNDIYNIGYDFRNFDSIYLSLFLWKRLEYIDYIKIDNVLIDSLCVPKGKKNKDYLDENILYRCLLEKKEYNIPKVFPSNHVFESSYDRLLKALDSIKKNGYPYNERYIILYNDEMKIRDGQHRACCLKYLYGNIEIPVMRIYLKDVY